jgi:hypothetical protein
MKPSFVAGAVIGYVLGARAGRERYEHIVRIARRVAGSQTIQATAGVLQAQAAEAAGRAKDRVISRIPLVSGAGSGRATSSRTGTTAGRPGTTTAGTTTVGATTSTANGHHR